MGARGVKHTMTKQIVPLGFWERALPAYGRSEIEQVLEIAIAFHLHQQFMKEYFDARVPEQSV